jgi:hypothetical protein
MSAADSVRILLGRGAADRQPLEPQEWKRVAARTAWVREIMGRLRDAQRAMDDRCTEAVERLSEEDFDCLFDAEQAKVDAIRALIDDVIERDLWPRHLYFGGL